MYFQTVTYYALEDIHIFQPCKICHYYHHFMDVEIRVQRLVS
jgi:hypothetical protein